MDKLRAYLDARPKGAKAAFAEKIGTSPSYLSQILAGKRPGFDMMVRIERASDGAVPLSAWAETRGEVA